MDSSDPRPAATAEFELVGVGSSNHQRIAVHAVAASGWAGRAADRLRVSAQELGWTVAEGGSGRLAIHDLDGSRLGSVSVRSGPDGLVVRVQARVAERVRWLPAVAAAAGIAAVVGLAALGVVSPTGAALGAVLAAMIGGLLGLVAAGLVVSGTGGRGARAFAAWSRRLPGLVVSAAG